MKWIGLPFLLLAVSSVGCLTIRPAGPFADQVGSVVGKPAPASKPAAAKPKPAASETKIAAEPGVMAEDITEANAHAKARELRAELDKAAHEADEPPALDAKPASPRGK